MKKQAKFIGISDEVMDGYFYKLSPPLKDYDGKKHSFVVISIATVAGEVETYIFPADIDGAITSWGELPGSQKGCDKPKKVLKDLGYKEVK